MWHTFLRHSVVAWNCCCWEPGLGGCPVERSRPSGVPLTKAVRVFFLCVSAAVQRCNKSMKSACAAIETLKSRQDAECREHQRYNDKARDVVTRLLRQIDTSNRQQVTSRLWCQLSNRRAQPSSQRSPLLCPDYLEYSTESVGTSDVNKTKFFRPRPRLTGL